MEPTSLIAAFAVPHLHGSIPLVLQDIAVRCTRLCESRAVCLRVHARLCRIWRCELQFATTNAHALQRLVPVLARFAELLVRFRDTLTRFAEDDPVFRLMLSRQLFVRLHQTHCGISTLSAELVLLTDRARVRETLEQLALAHVQWRADRYVQELLDKQRSGYAAPMQRELRSTDAELGLLSEICAALEGDSKQAAAAVSTATARLLVLTVGIDVDPASSLTLVSWRRVRGDAAAWGEASASSEFEPLKSSVLMDKPECDIAMDNTPLARQHQCIHDERIQLVAMHSACHLCAPVALAFPIPLPLLATTTFEQWVSQRSEQLVALFARVALRLHVTHEHELCDDASSASVGTGNCDFGLTNLNLRERSGDCEPHDAPLF